MHFSLVICLESILNPSAPSIYTRVSHADMYSVESIYLVVSMALATLLLIFYIYCLVLPWFSRQLLYLDYASIYHSFL